MDKNIDVKFLADISVLISPESKNVVFGMMPVICTVLTAQMHESILIKFGM